MKLYDFQVDYLRGLPAKYIFGADTGTGKTFMALAHYDKHAYLTPLLIIAPASKINTRDWERDVEEYFAGRLKPEVEYYSYEKFSRLPSLKQYRATKDQGICHDYIQRHFGGYAVIADECLTGETLINTKDGLKEIADIKIGERVLSRNDTTEQLEYKRVTRKIERQSDDKFYLVSYTGGAIISTYNHPHYVNGEYKIASQIKKGDYLYATTKPSQKSNTEAWGISDMQGLPPRVVSVRVDNTPSSTVERKQGIYLRKTLRGSAYFACFERPRIQDVKYADGTIESTVVTETERYRPTDMGARPLTPTLKRWERLYFSRAANSLREFTHPGYGMGIRTAGTNAERNGQWFSNGLQNRYRQSLIAYWNRSRRDESQFTKREMARQQKDETLKRVRVESVTVLKRADIERAGVVRNPSSVYCIEVEDNHNFFANGILTHNCHKAKNPQSGIGKRLFAVSQQASFFVGLSATPLPNGWIDAANYYKIFGFVKHLTDFKKRYVREQNYKGFPEIVGYNHEGELQRLWNRIAKPLSKQLALDLPPTTVVPVTLQAGSEYIKIKKDRIFGGLFMDNPSALLHALRRSIIAPKVVWLENFLDEVSDNVVVFYNYKEERNQILAMIKKSHKGRTVFRQDGEKHDVPDKTKWANLHRTITLAQYQSGSTGIELTYAATTVYLSPTYSYSNYEQSIGRTNRNGQTKKMTLYMLCAPTTLERDVWTALREKRDFQESQWFDSQMLDNKHTSVPQLDAPSIGMTLGHDDIY
jgi:hypothetical protein